MLGCSLMRRTLAVWQIIGVGAAVVGDMSSRPYWGLYELDFVFSTLVVRSPQPTLVDAYMLSGPPESAWHSHTWMKNNAFLHIICSVQYPDVSGRGVQALLRLLGAWLTAAACLET